MLRVQSNDSEIYLYLQRVLPDRIFDFIISNSVEIYSIIPIAGFLLSDFRQSKSMVRNNSLNVLLEFIFVSEFCKILIDDFNHLNVESIEAVIDKTYYLTIDKVSKTMLRKAITEVESWRSYGLAFYTDDNMVKIYVGAFDDEGYLMISFRYLEPDKAREFSQVIF